jgi:CheY-like chemotaxis protein
MREDRFCYFNWPFATSNSKVSGMIEGNHRGGKIAPPPFAKENDWTLKIGHLPGDWTLTSHFLPLWEKMIRSHHECVGGLPSAGNEYIIPVVFEDCGSEEGNSHMGAKPKVLLVDDEERFRMTTARLLRGAGLDVATASGGKEALTQVEAQHFDVIILDMRMPEMSGAETLKGIKKIDPGVEVIVLTGHASVDTAFEIMKLGGFDYLFKPCSIEELTDKIDSAFDRKGIREKTLKGGAKSEGERKKV